MESDTFITRVLRSIWRHFANSGDAGSERIRTCPSKQPAYDPNVHRHKTSLVDRIVELIIMSSLEDIVSGPLLLRKNKALGLQIEHRAVAAAERNQLVVRA